jgi:dTDP-4-amino-4,6-dideoxygalactose transaminase
LIFAGRAVDLKPIEISRSIWFVDSEDACHAPGVLLILMLKLRIAVIVILTGCAFSCFSSVKHIACGEGGMVTTNDGLYKTLLSLYAFTELPKMDMQYMKLLLWNRG